MCAVPGTCRSGSVREFVCVCAAVRFQLRGVGCVVGNRRWVESGPETRHGNCWEGGRRC